jgi:hypothetical protein
MKRKNYWIVFLILFFNPAFAAGGKSYDGFHAFNWEVIRLRINNIDLPLSNNGAVYEAPGAPGYYPNGQTTLGFLFCGGLAFTGYVDDSLRASWMAASVLLEEWQPGKWGMDPNNPLARFYVVSSSDGPGSQAYIDWVDAVSLGAQFIDLNGDGQYDPIVDKPPVIGDKIIWTVFNDNTFYTYPGGFGTPPMGLEIHQTVWALARTDWHGDVIFFWQRLINTGGNQIDSLIYSVWEDADIGDYTDDLVGCDTTLNLGYCYNDGDDNNYGNDPPAFGIKLLQGPVVNSPGDTAFVYQGPSASIDTLYNRKNLSMTSFMYHGLGGAPPSPQTAQVARYYQEGGKDAQGNPIDPTLWGVGGTSTTDPKFVYSGDPVVGNGWLDDDPADKVFLVNSGPFDMAAGDTQDIVFAYIVRQGSSPLNSVQIMKQATGFLDDFFPDSTIIVSVDDKSLITGIPGSFRLLQNYPNPFNPTTTINYQLAGSGEVELTIYNLLGQQIRTLVNAKQPAGFYKIEWNGRDDAGREVASGVYVYQLKTEGIIQNLKMILLI